MDFSKKVNKKETVTDAELNQGTLTPGQEDILNEKGFTNNVTDEVTGEFDESKFTTEAKPFTQFFDFANGKNVLTGTYCGHGKTIGEGKGATRTHLIFDRESGEFVLVPQWDGLKKMSEIGELGNKTVRIIYLGRVPNKENPEDTDFHKVKLQYHPQAPEGIFKKSASEIQEVLNADATR